MSARRHQSSRKSVKNLSTVSTQYFFKSIKLCLLRSYRMYKCVLSFAEIGQFQKIVGGLIELVDELAKEAETEKMKVSLTLNSAFQWLSQKMLLSSYAKALKHLNVVELSFNPTQLSRVCRTLCAFVWSWAQHLVNNHSVSFQAIGARNLLKSVAKQREAQQQQLQALIAEKKMQLER